MEAHEVNRVRAKLAFFVADAFASAPRKDQRDKTDCYLRGLMLDGRRKSIQAMASRLPDGNEQNLQQFVNQSTWDPLPVRRRIAERMSARISPEAWVVDDVSFPKDGRMSVAVAPQYCGALGKRANCQVAVSVHACTATASCPLQWRLFLPKEWADDAERRAACKVPAEIGHREKWRLALDILDELTGWGVPPRVVLADAAYGTNATFRNELTERGLDYVLSIRSDTAHPLDAVPEAPARKGINGCWPQPRYRQAPPAVTAHAINLGRSAFTEITWRHGSHGPMRSHFAALRVRPASNSITRPLRARASAEQGWWDGVLPDLWLLAEWPSNSETPTEYWFSNLPVQTPLKHLVSCAKLRWRVEHDYRELKHGLGLDHFEGRSWPGWHHHVTLVTAAHAFLTEQRLSPKVPKPASPTTRSSTCSKTS
ncbi:IS701 family transposase [Streptomyces endophyticus]|uniref:IS701 family transposase n=1 Tax=Streptomyces endophyticus TaxID=714166 RepID=A0ABU6F215_9ACTN|nr:IS701 family transposase [Streptomyces endophyticus]MEB8338018.1 IS701 family transposase [Streptomyces endophyticus]